MLVEVRAPPDRERRPHGRDVQRLDVAQVQQPVQPPALAPAPTGSPPARLLLPPSLTPRPTARPGTRPDRSAPNGPTDAAPPRARTPVGVIVGATAGPIRHRPWTSSGPLTLPRRRR